MPDEECAALKEYAELCEAWERLGVLDTAPDYEEWLEQQYDNYLRDKQVWRARWKRKTERAHELEREIARIKGEIAVEALPDQFEPADPPTPPGDYRAARGAFNWQEGDEPAEQTVRRMRDGRTLSASDEYQAGEARHLPKIGNAFAADRYIAALEAQTAAQQQRIEALETGLEPFAAVAEAIEEVDTLLSSGMPTPDDEVLMTYRGVKVCDVRVIHIRNARKALRAGDEG